MENVRFLTNTTDTGGSPSGIPAVLARLEWAVHELQKEVKSRSDVELTPVVPEQSSRFALHAGTDTQLQIDVRRALSVRQLRKRMFGMENFSGPPWEILLHLFDAHTAQRRETVGNTWLGADIPASTALRWLKRLEDTGMVHLRDDPCDARRRFVELAPRGIDAMTAYFKGIAPFTIAG
jgi:DNA-binding MarR family transcriptional regulator